MKDGSTVKGWIIVAALVLAGALAAWAVSGTAATATPVTPPTPVVDNTLPTGPLTWVPPNWCQTGRFFLKIHVVNRAPSQAWVGSDRMFYMSLGPAPDRVDMYINIQALDLLPPKLALFRLKHPDGAYVTQDSCE